MVLRLIKERVSFKQGAKSSSLPQERLGWKVWLFFIGVIFFAIVWVFPAVLLQGKTIGPIRIKQAAGSVWDGQARLALLSGGEIPGTWFWHIGWKKGPALFLSGDLLEKEVSISLSFLDGGWGFRVQEGSIHLPAHLLEYLGSIFPTLRPNGVLLANWHDFELRVDPLELKPNSNVGSVWAKVRWDDAAMGISKKNPLGTYVLDVKPVGSLMFDLKISTEKGALVVSGGGRVGIDRGHFMNTFRARMSADKEDQVMGRFLDLVGVKQTADRQMFVDF